MMKCIDCKNKTTKPRRYDLESTNMDVTYEVDLSSISSFCPSINKSIKHTIDEIDKMAL